MNATRAITRSAFRRLRWQAGLTQRQIAERAGVSQQGVSSFERGGKGIATVRLCGIAEWLVEMTRA